MPHHKSSKKRVITSKKASQRNQQNKSRVKTSIKRVLESKDKESALAALKAAYSVLDKAAKTNLIHKNKAANQKSQLSHHIQKMATSK